MNKIIAANWKMHGNNNFVSDYFEFFKKNLKNKCNNEIIIFPSYLHLDKANIFKKKYNSFKLGAQSCHFNNKIAQTSSISADMLSDIGCDYVLVGHSEWRNNNDEKTISHILQNVLENNMVPIYCVGENLSEKENSKTESVIETQLKNIIDNSDLFNNKIVIAYEPVWAIGSGLTPEISVISFIHSYIKSKLLQKLPSLQEKDIMVLYGGSVNLKNTKEILKTNNVDGVLIGGASINIEEFTNICNEKL